MIEKYMLNEKFRLTLTRKCNFECSFCHSEGTDTSVRSVDFEETAFINTIELLRTIYSSVHLTGGEPTLYNHLSQLVDLLKLNNYSVSMTSNGLFDYEHLKSTLSKLSTINISLHSFSADYLRNKLGITVNPEEKINTIKNNIILLNSLIPVSLNTVVSDDLNYQEIFDVIDFAISNNIKINLLAEWDTRAQSKKMIHYIIDKYNYKIYEKVYVVPGSNVKYRYTNGDGHIVEYKTIEHVYPEFLCNNCDIKNDCQEGYSFLRVEDSPIRFRPCIHRKSYDYDYFVEKIFPEISTLINEMIVREDVLDASKL